MSSFMEYDDSKMCPCESQKSYSMCCKLKRIQWGYNENGELVKQVWISPEIKEALENSAQMFEQYYGRKPDKDDYVAPFAPIYQDKTLFEIMREMKLAGMSPEYIYAYYKTDGLLLSSSNEDVMSEKDKKEFIHYCEEYRDAIEAPVSQTINLLQFTAFGNECLESVYYKLKKMIINSLNDFIHRHTNEPSGIYNYEMKGELDYLLFSALKTINTVEGISLIVDEQIPECIHALGRSLFENYMYLNRINCHPHFFKQKLLPKVDHENYRFLKKKDGRSDHNKVCHIETGEIYNVQVRIAELKSSFSNPEDHDLYDWYYSNSCQYVHVDVLSAANYFSTYDPYEILNPSLQAAIITLSITILLYKALIHNRLVSSQFYQDGSYLIRQLTKELLGAIEILNTDPEHTQPIFSVLLKRMQNLFRETPDDMHV